VPSAGLPSASAGQLAWKANSRHLSQELPPPRDLSYGGEPDVRARIHGGASEIGGSCVEVEHDGQRIVIDLGRPLTACWDEELPLPEIPGLRDSDPSLQGILISHAHPDHYGLASVLPRGARLYIGEAAERILVESQFFGAAPVLPPAVGHFHDRQPLELGPFRVTPYLIDHSAFDGYSLLVEAGGRRLFYSGDIRGHGRKSRSFDAFLRQALQGIDALLLEGTRLGRAGGGCASEVDVEELAASSFADSPSLVLVCFSPQNIDRYVSLYRAARRAGRTFVIDLYAESVARATGRETIPNSGWEDVRVYVPQAQRIRVKQAEAYERVNAIRLDRIWLEDMQMLGPGQFVWPFRQSMIRELERVGVPPGTRAIWSMWPGYLEDERSAPLLDFFERHQIELDLIHASGHATVRDLGRFAEALAPERVVPIHTAHPARYEEIYGRVERHADGEWWEV
jgi:ribonuclease J